MKSIKVPFIIGYNRSVTNGYITPELPFLKIRPSIIYYEDMKTIKSCDSIKKHNLCKYCKYHCYTPSDVQRYDLNKYGHEIDIYCYEILCKFLLGNII